MALDSMLDMLLDGRRLRSLPIFDPHHGECLTVEMDISVREVRVTMILNGISSITRWSENIVFDDNQ